MGSKRSIEEIQKLERLAASQAVENLILSFKRKPTKYLKKRPQKYLWSDLENLIESLKNPGSSHHWGEPFPYFADVDQAAQEIGDFCVRWGRIGVIQTKEKFGTARVYCDFGLSSLLSVTHPSYTHYGPYPEWLRKLDQQYLYKIVNKISKFVVPYQVFIYRLAYKRAIKKYPHIKKEILSGAGYRELLKGVVENEK